MASFNHLPQTELPSVAALAPDLDPSTNDEIFAHFQEIFSSQIEPDVVQLILTECDYNVNATLESLLAITGETSESSKQKTGINAAADKSIYNNRVSTIYKSNEGLYSEDVALNGEDLKIFDTGQFSDLARLCSSGSTCTSPSSETQASSPCKEDNSLDTPATENLTLQLERVESGDGCNKSLSSQQRPEVRAGWESISELCNQIQDVVSPDSDRSIEADASESIGIDIGEVEANGTDASPTLLTDCNNSLKFDAMASRQFNKKGNAQAARHSYGDVWAALSATASLFYEPQQSGQQRNTSQQRQKNQTQETQGQPKHPANKQFYPHPPPAKINPNMPGSSHNNPHWKRQQQHPNNVNPHLPPANINPNMPGSSHNNPQWKRQQQHPSNVKAMSPKERVVMLAANGEKVLVLLRGCPGSGKTTLAKEIKFKGVIYSTDNYFINNGEYCFDPTKLPEAHTRNKLLTMRAMQMRRTPIIIDNTNLLEWEMAPYVTLALQHGYYIYFLEPQTPWKYNAKLLAQKNTHNIPYDKIVAMLMRFDHTITVRGMLDKHINTIGATKMNTDCKPMTKMKTDNKPAVETAVAPNPKSSNPNRRKRRPKPDPGHAQTPNGPDTASRGGMHSSRTGDQSSDPDTDSDGWSVLNHADVNFSSNFRSAQEKLTKSRSVPDLVHSDAFFNRKPRDTSISTDVVSPSCSLVNTGVEPADRPQKLEPELSENMRDLIDLDFSPMHTDPNTPPKQDRVDTASLLLLDDDESHKKTRNGRLAAAFENLPQDWAVPAYPVGHGDEALNSSRRAHSESFPQQDGAANGAVSSEQDRMSENPDEDGMSDERDQNPMSALKSFFSSVPDDQLKDIYDKCNGDLHWVVDLLLDAGYEMCFQNVNEDLFQKSGSSLEGLAEISPDGNNELAAAPSDPSDLMDVHASDGAPKKESTSPTNDCQEPGQSPATEAGEKLLLRIDPIFAMQLQEMFGPVGFHLSQALYYGSDLNIYVPSEIARGIHSCWAESLKAKFESEDAEIEKMMNSVALDENYAKQLQEEEDALLAATLQSDPLGEHFPPLETKHLLITQEKAIPKIEDLASRIKRRQLYEMFPKIDRKALDDVFNANNASFSETVQAIETSFCPDQKPKMVFAPEQLEEYERALVKFAEQESLLLEMGRTKKKDEEVEDYSEPTYDDWRTEATLHYRLRQECFSKAKSAYDKGMIAAASFYSQQGRVHSKKLHEANKRASEKILEMKNAHRKSDTLDLHMLHVHEAINALTEFLETKKTEIQNGSNNQMSLKIITGKGNHSVMGVPKIKPAVLDYLLKQNYSHCDSNGGHIEVLLKKSCVRK